MTFCEFVNLLFPYIGGDLSKSDFVIELVRHIMEEPHTEEDKKLEEAGEYVPLPQESDSCYRIFKGIRPLSEKNARNILSHLDRTQFEQYIQGFPFDTRSRIVSALQGKGIKLDVNQIETVCANIFISILEDCANRKRKPRVVAASKQLLPAKDTIANVTITQKAADGSDNSAKKKPPLQPENGSDGIDNISLPVYPEVRSILSETDAGEVDSELEVKESELPELSEPKYYREYRQEFLKQFEMYVAWNPEPLDPGLIEKWRSVHITDEFCRSIKDYGIENFLALTPSDLQPMRKVLTEGNVADHIRSAVHFVEHMEAAMDHMLITRENQKIFLDIAKFVELLGRYNRCTKSRIFKGKTVKV